MFDTIEYEKARSMLESMIFTFDQAISDFHKDMDETFSVVSAS